MKLYYRGIAYESTTPAVEAIDVEVAGTYRGAPWKLLQVTKVPVAQPTYELKYRGVAYGRVKASIPDTVATPAGVSAASV